MFSKILFDFYFKNSKQRKINLETSKPLLNNNKCEICNSKLNLSFCGRCKSIYYCSKEHQKQDWPEHKKNCKLEKRDNY